MKYKYETEGFPVVTQTTGSTGQQRVECMIKAAELIMRRVMK